MRPIKIQKKNLLLLKLLYTVCFKRVQIQSTERSTATNGRTPFLLIVTLEAKSHNFHTCWKGKRSYEGMLEKGLYAIKCLL